MSLEIRFRAMGSRILAVLDNEDPQAKAALQMLPTMFENWEDILSRFRPESELSRLNKQGGAQYISPTFRKVLLAAEEAYHRSAGLINPLILPALEAAGYDRSFDLFAEEPGALPYTVQDSHPVPLDIFELNSDEERRTLPFGTRLDLGGVAKGWAAQEAMQSLSQWGPALVDAGGDIAISAPPSDANSWLIGLQDPYQSDCQLLTFSICQGGVATSGRDLRQWQKAGQPQHHIIDPRTQQPAKTDVVTATVLAPDTLQAEMAAKIVLILGSRLGLDWLESRPTYSGLVILEDGQLLLSSRIHQYL